MLTTMGQIVQGQWNRLVYRFPQVQLDEFVVMPNHVHGIIVITEADGETAETVGKGTTDIVGRGTARTKDDLQPNTTRCAPTTEQFGKPVPGSIPTIMRSFKSAVTVRINRMRNTPGVPVWQRNYYEHIIRDNKELNRIREYIRYNPDRWESDRENL
jgi:REP element-mobilizing transposase RayT